MTISRMTRKLIAFVRMTFKFSRMMLTRIALNTIDFQQNDISVQYAVSKFLPLNERFNIGPKQ
jgi:hypothetical protein